MLKTFRRLALVASAALIAIGGATHAQAQGQSAPYYPGAQTSVNPNFSYPAQVYTASGVTPAVACNGALAAGTPCVQGLGGVSAATLEVIGTGLTTVTFQVQGTNDGVNFFPINTALITAPGTVATTQTATANGLYVLNLAGLTNFRIVTSGTFTATSVSFKVVASANKGLL